MPDAFVIRTAVRDDVPSIVRLLADDVLGAARERVGEEIAPEYWTAFESMRRQAANEILVATVDGEVVACLQLTIIPGLSRGGMTRGQIEGVRVASSRRGSGIGERLVRAAIDQARSAGCGMVQLSTDVSRASALRFYERLGFIPSHVGMKLPL